jgi:hypothetical protein
MRRGVEEGRGRDVSAPHGSARMGAGAQAGADGRAGAGARAGEAG